MRWRWKPVLGGAAAVTAAATVALVFVGNDAGDTTITDSCTADGTTIEIDCRWIDQLPDPARVNSQEIVDKARAFADVPPTGAGPWPFAVANSRIGLKVRSTNVMEAEQLGGIQELHVAWVVCQEDSGFDPDPTTGAGSLWYKVKWDQQTPTTAFSESAPNADGTAWAYSGYLYPTGHNGDVPAC